MSRVASGCSASVETDRTIKDAGDEIPLDVAPAHIKFLLRSGETIRGEMRVIPIHGADAPAFRQRYPHLYQTINDLRAILRSKPVAVPMGASLPEWNLIDGEQTLHAKIRYFSFQSHSGIFFLAEDTQAPDEPNPIDENHLYCAYQGLSSDGRWFITFRLPIQHPLLPFQRADTDNDATAFRKRFEGLLNQQPDESFRPRPDDVRQTLASLRLPKSTILVPRCSPAGRISRATH